MADERAQRLAAYVRQAAVAADYDIDRPRGGDKLRLATDAGMSPSTLSRLLSGDRLPDPRYYEGLANALRVSVIDLLIEAGVISESLREPRASVPVLTIDEAADAWGLDAAGRELLAAMYKHLTEKRNE